MIINYKSSQNFCAYEQTFSMLKPNAISKNLSREILNRIRQEGLTVTDTWCGIASEQAMRKIYEDCIDKFPEKELNNAFHWLSSNPILAMIVEGDNAVTKLLKIRTEIRAKYCPGEPIFNLLHCSDTEQAAKQEICDFFRYA